MGEEERKTYPTGNNSVAFLLTFFAGPLYTGGFLGAKRLVG
jgi:hypothetical protein